MKCFRQGRQGDVLIMEAKKAVNPTEQIPLDNGRIVLAYGEVTGHAHAIKADPTQAEFFRISDKDAQQAGDRLLRAKVPVVLLHEEHDPVNLTARDWIVRIQREYSPEAIRNVAD